MTACCVPSPFFIKGRSEPLEDRRDEYSLALWEALMASEYRDRALAIFDEFGADVAPECLGSMDIYAHLAAIIPRDRGIYDIGCAYAFQSVYFLGHEKYVAVDRLPMASRLVTANSEHHEQSCGDFLHEGGPFPRKSFAICAYVPPWYGENAADLVKAAFADVFTFYPRLS